MYISFLCSSDHDRIRLKVAGTQCTIHGTNALEKDKGIWDFYISAGKDASFHEKHFHFHVSVSGKNDTLKIYFLNFIEDRNLRHDIEIKVHLTKCSVASF